jgi:hypothetical protein
MRLQETANAMRQMIDKLWPGLAGDERPALVTLELKELGDTIYDLEERLRAIEALLPNQ